MNASDDPERIEREIADTRTSMTSTLTELDGKRMITQDSLELGGELGGIVGIDQQARVADDLDLR